MSILLTLIHLNKPLAECKKYRTEADLAKELGKRDLGAGRFNERESRRVAQRILNALSQSAVAEQLSQEWDFLPSRLRMDISDIANGGQYKSGNMAKGIQYANELLGGRILRTEKDTPTERQLRVHDGKLVSLRHGIDPAKVRAQAMYKATERPPNYHTLSKREQKRIDRELSEVRREMRRNG